MSDMREGMCPKCGSSEIYEKRHRSDRADYGIAIPISTRFIITYAGLHLYVCATCGYVESYVYDPKLLDEIARKWNRVDGSKRKNDE